MKAARLVGPKQYEITNAELVPPQLGAAVVRNSHVTICEAGDRGAERSPVTRR